MRVKLICMILKYLHILIILPILSLITNHVLSQEIVGDVGTVNSVLPTYQKLHPAGKSVGFGGRPIDLVMAPDGKHLYVKDNRGVVVIDTISWKVIQQTTVAGGTSFHGIAVSSDGKKLYVTNAKSQLAVADIDQNGTVIWRKPITLIGNGESFPCGLTLFDHDQKALVCLSRNNSLAIVDLTVGKLMKEIPVGIAPWCVVLSKDETTAYVTNWGGRHPSPGVSTADSAGSAVRVDTRGIGNSGTLSIVDVTTGMVTAEIDTGLHPCDLKLTSDGKHIITADANSDSISIIDAASKKRLKLISTRPFVDSQHGSAPTGIALSKDDKTAYVTCGGSNAVAVISLSDGVMKGLIPAGWYPGSLTISNGSLYIANVKGLGSRLKELIHPGRSVFNALGTVQQIEIPNSNQLTAYTQQALNDLRTQQAKLHYSRKKSESRRLPVPTAPNDKSVFEHIIYIIKENRTYDQVFGDIKQGNGDPTLCTFGRKITPNHHALAEQFTLLDNFYCNGVNSADGHSWATEGDVTDHLEKSQGGYTRSYTWGDDALNYCSSGFIWDNVLSHGLSFINFGEMDYTGSIPPAKFIAYYHDYFDDVHKIRYTHNVGIANLKKYTMADYPGWNTSIPDQIRADIFIRYLHKFEKKNSLPNFTLLYLPNDHIGADISPASYLADNDLALGKVVEGITHSRFWPKTCVFVVEDDSQDGWDHVDGHRSLCLVISPYTKRKFVDHHFYNQTSVLHTIGLILGIPPMNQMDASAPIMTTCFTNELSLKAYHHLTNTIPILDDKHAMSRIMPEIWMSSCLSFDRPDMNINRSLNELIWKSVHQKHIPYPQTFSGAHGKGLNKLGLKLTSNSRFSITN